MAITPEAFQALQALHDGARYNIMHTVARELIDAGLAHAGFGILEITEAGRIWVRRGVQPVATRSYIVDDVNVANLEQVERLDLASQATNVNSPPTSSAPLQRDDSAQSGWHPPLVLPPEAPMDETSSYIVHQAKEHLPPAPMTDTTLAWSRDRAVRAAGAASGQTDHWPPPNWLTTFMDAYEHAGEQ
jgi:hypothetical protein